MHTILLTWYAIAAALVGPEGNGCRPGTGTQRGMLDPIFQPPQLGSHWGQMPALLPVWLIPQLDLIPALL